MSEQTYEIGLVGAGAISAGAYTGGVVDFMVQALDAWYAAKEQDQQNSNTTVPPHDVKLSVFSGASAGAMTAAIATAYLASEQPPVTSPDDARNKAGQNKLYDSWVERIDISHLLESKDLAHDNAPVTSLLDSSILSDIANSGVSINPRPAPRPYLASNFELILTVTNLRGIPYGFNLLGSQQGSYNMSLHADYVHFRINQNGDQALPDRHSMRWVDFQTDSPIKDKLKLAALASGAFPFGLAPRLLDNSIASAPATDLYGARSWPVPTPDAVPHQCTSYRNIPASFGQLPPEYHYAYYCVDGGVMNNEPLELARKTLLTDGQHNPREGNKATKGLLLIDPFPNNSEFTQQYPASPEVPDIISTGMALFSALTNQARFKPDELLLAADENVYSRFMVAPSRDNSATPIACGTLGGFGGFLKQDFRAHDFFLGRRNMQKFLKDHFVLPENNPLFEHWPEEMRAKYCVKDKDGKPLRYQEQQPGQNQGEGEGEEQGEIEKQDKDTVKIPAPRLLPIIPLVNNSLIDGCYKPVWPSYSQDELEQLRSQIKNRLDNVVDHLIQHYLSKQWLITRWIAQFVVFRKKPEILDKACVYISAELKKAGIMT
ncbi:patatin-like phospholipase family protein [Undibacterium umbellatum]|uniref:Patatin-like phospholipase family protein n=1 Tax=Undibacterium umbellatum TaxID=2762300 RepID=A0ABR6Z8X1_9BURK|nr:patatin-like phospholipase family protein [Undibacterium umbellatum]MBC3908123.1 patatin-like phospholipase family protein [Undibacterium umbellatum]